MFRQTNYKQTFLAITDVHNSAIQLPGFNKTLFCTTWNSLTVSRNHNTNTVTERPVSVALLLIAPQWLSWCQGHRWRRPKQLIVVFMTLFCSSAAGSCSSFRVLLRVATSLPRVDHIDNSTPAIISVKAATSSSLRNRLLAFRSVPPHVKACHLHSVHVHPTVDPKPEIPQTL